MLFWRKNEMFAQFVPRNTISSVSLTNKVKMYFCCLKTANRFTRERNKNWEKDTQIGLDTIISARFAQHWCDTSAENLDQLCWSPFVGEFSNVLHWPKLTKGKNGKRTPIGRYQIFGLLFSPLPLLYTLISAPLFTPPVSSTYISVDGWWKCVLLDFSLQSVIQRG